MTISGTVDLKANAGRGTGAAVVGAVLGLVTVTVLGALVFLLGDGPDFTGHLAGKIALSLVYAAPYLLVLMASRVRRSGVRGAFLAVFGLLSLAASFSDLLSLVSVVLLPATFAIWFAAARSLTASVRPLAPTAFAAVAGVFIAGMVGLSFFALIGLVDPEPRCWVFTLSADGEYVWEARPDLVDQGEVQTITLSGPDIRSSCVSDIISNAEAGMGVGFLAIAFLAMLLAMRFRWIRAPDSGRA